MYSPAYKCRLCGEVFEAVKYPGPGTAPVDILPWLKDNPYFVHGCETGNFGIADFVGAVDFENYPIRTMGDATKIAQMIERPPADDKAFADWLVRITYGDIPDKPV